MSPPEIDRARARTALSQAQAVQAELYAASTFKEGRSELDRAETEMVIQLSRPRPFRHFSQSQRLFQRASDTLRLAAQQSVARQRELEQQTEDTLREFDEQGSNMIKQLAQVPTVFIDKERIDNGSHRTECATRGSSRNPRKTKVGELSKCLSRRLESARSGDSALPKNLRSR
jgi:hypothetical protein